MRVCAGCTEDAISGKKACLKGYLLQSAPKTAAVQENATQRNIARIRTVCAGDCDCDCDISVQLLQFKIELDWIRVQPPPPGGRDEDGFHSIPLPEMQVQMFLFDRSEIWACCTAARGLKTGQDKTSAWTWTWTLSRSQTLDGQGQDIGTARRRPRKERETIWSLKAGTANRREEVCAEYTVVSLGSLHGVKIRTVEVGTRRVYGCKYS
ncbi:hypothetical protein DFH08DRAFT_984166 [Mycena albidolilacea]|uniref:Uncharacterized protein n=1 Tax=Mycena albidolilacea TaxID=1033008 RepID=A0AAD7AWW8_9AGAR|nr:hypothetical protein DFH08DRAFT_984166 [Mycena albidolilacea]